jgi:hypothetical protein
VHEAATSPLNLWENFYVIIGSSAAALTGLQFVVIALVAEARKRSTTSEIDAFGTPTIVHFCAVLLISAILSAPWPALSGAGIALGVCGLLGVGYVALVVRRTRRQSGYQPVFEDWLWHATLPAVAYAALLVAAATIAIHITSSLFVIAGVALLLLFIGIHNAWDSVTYVATERLHAPPDSPDGVPPTSAVR